MGMSRNAGGGMATRTVACLPALVGAWEKSGGGGHQDTASAWGFDYDALRRPDLAPGPTRTINHSQLGRALCELRDPPIAALFVAANNPAVTCPDQNRVVAGLSREDLFTVVHDAFMTDTARYADIVLPAAIAVETEDFYRSYGTLYVQHGPRLVEPAGESRSNLWLVQELARRFGLDDPVFRRTPREHFDVIAQGGTGAVRQLSADGLVDCGPIKIEPPMRGPEKTFFYAQSMADDGLPPLPEWRPDDDASDRRYPLRLLTAPGHFQHHTAFDGVARLRKREGEPTCLLHPTDAGARGIADGDAVKLFNQRGNVGLRARVNDDTQPGVVVVATQRNRARYLSGGPVNVLTGDELTDIGAGATYQSTWVDAEPLR
jgi:anaerobic selenocysteine-containing dehydrogenase